VPDRHRPVHRRIRSARIIDVLSRLVSTRGAPMFPAQQIMGPESRNHFETKGITEGTNAAGTRRLVKEVDAARGSLR
jgi:hypothetical protein